MDDGPKLYGLKNCDTCRKAMRAVPELQLVDVRTDGVPEDLLDRALADFPQTLVNTRSTTWRGLSAKDRDRPAKTLLRDHPSLMKRPLIVVDNTLFLGWNSGIEGDVRAAL